MVAELVLAMFGSAARTALAGNHPEENHPKDDQMQATSNAHSPASDGGPSSPPGSVLPSVSAATSDASVPVAIDRLPYRIELHLALDSSARIDEARRTSLLKQFLALVHRFVSPPWLITIANPPSPLASGDLESLEAQDLVRFSTSFDKVWLVRISSGSKGAGLVLSGREYDLGTRRLGPLQVREAPVLADAPRSLLQFAIDLFCPTALVTGQDDGRAILRVQGGSIAPATDLGRVATKGTVFFPIRLITQKDRSVTVRRIAYTYLRVEAMDGPIARCAIVSALRDPLTQRVAQPNRLAAMGIKPGDSSLRFRFITRTDLAPAAGYTLVARAVPDGLAHELGMTDRAGRIVIKPNFVTGLAIFRLVAGASEPLVEFPMMPGESPDEHEIAIDPKPQAVAFQVQLDALRDEIIDLVAQRARLEKRLEARLAGDDLVGLEQGLKEYAALPPREQYTERLDKLKTGASRLQTESKTAVLTKNTQARFTELQSLIDRYLDNETFQAYAEALGQKQKDRSAAAKAKSVPRRRARPGSPLTGPESGGTPAPPVPNQPPSIPRPVPPEGPFAP
jgi:hypothetical protein